MDVKFSIVIPMYNEEAVIGECYRRLTDVMSGVGEPYEIVFVNDGSRDESPRMAAELCERDGSVVLVNFARNFGQMAALTAGLRYARGQAVIVIDCDLQDPPELIPEMIKEWRGGWDVVYGKRKVRKGESALKRLSSAMFMKILKKLAKIDMESGTGEFRLMDRQVVDAIVAMPEHNKYLRGLVSWVGFKQKSVEFERVERFAGETKYSFGKMMKLAIDSLMSFSHAPLTLATGLGFFISAGGFVYLVVVLLMGIFGNPAQGWASTMAVLLFTQGIVLMVLGVTGEYIGRVYEEIKGRPNYIVREVLGRPDLKRNETR